MPVNLIMRDKALCKDTERCDGKKEEVSLTFVRVGDDGGHSSAVRDDSKRSERDQS